MNLYQLKFITGPIQGPTCKCLDMNSYQYKFRIDLQDTRTGYPSTCSTRIETIEVYILFLHLIPYLDA